jgi:hypothetical protein
MPIIAFVVVAGNAIADDTDDRVASLQEKWRCPIFSYLAAIHRARSKTEQNRYLILEMTYPGDGRYYTQCAFFDGDKHIHCEAASPYYDERLKDYFSDDRIKALSSLGYSTEISPKNFYVERPVPDMKSLYDVAGLLVETLGRVFDMTADDKLIYHAPLVKRTPKRFESLGLCSPLIS